MRYLKSESLQEPICDTCLTKLDSTPFRKLVLKNKKGDPLIICIHYFFPCWDLDLLTEKYPKYEIAYAGFALNSAKLITNTKTVRNLQNNCDLW